MDFKDRTVFASVLAGVTLRDIGIFIVDRVPLLRPLARWIYLRLPWHDTPTSWLESMFGEDPDVTFIQIGAFDGVAGSWES